MRPIAHRYRQSLSSRSGWRFCGSIHQPSSRRISAGVGGGSSACVRLSIHSRTDCFVGFVVRGMVMAAHRRSNQERFRVLPAGSLDLLEFGAAFVQIVIDEDAAVVSERHGALLLLQVEGFHGASHVARRAAPSGWITPPNAKRPQLSMRAFHGAQTYLVSSKPSESIFQTTQTEAILGQSVAFQKALFCSASTRHFSSSGAAPTIASCAAFKLFAIAYAARAYANTRR